MLALWPTASNIFVRDIDSNFFYGILKSADNLSVGQWVQNPNVMSYCYDTVTV